MKVTFVDAAGDVVVVDYAADTLTYTPAAVPAPAPAPAPPVTPLVHRIIGASHHLVPSHEPPMSRRSERLFNGVQSLRKTLPCVAMPCLAPPRRALPRRASPSHAAPRPAQPCQAVPSHAMPRLAPPCRVKQITSLYSFKIHTILSKILSNIFIHHLHYAAAY